ncbi:MAG: hypothetical protein HGB37_02735 [Candidatus Moranbacteria bacterium]|nr:hypothetical protein [Candidatus Moranbacteria bacterium]
MDHSFVIIGIGIAHAAGVIEDATPIAKVISNALTLILSLSGALAMLSFGVSGAIYITAAGDEGRMKRAKAGMMFSLVGVLVCICALIVVRTVAGMV